MALSVAYEDSATIGTTEYSLTNDSTTLASQTDDGIYEVLINVNSMDVADQFEFKAYEKIIAGGTQRVKAVYVLTGIQTSMLSFVIGMSLHGWEVTGKKLAGTDRTVEWSIRKVS